MNLALPIALVGELNPYGQNPRFALYHEPAGASGDRLRRILGLPVAAYEDLPKYNLCVGFWDPVAAHARAMEIRERHRFVVALGVKVAHSFPRGPRMWESREDQYGVVLALPHPSGRNRIWNNPGEAVLRARRLLDQHWPFVAWGSAA